MKLAAWIMLIFTFTLFGLLAVSALAAEAVLTDEEKLLCQRGGGCLFITQDLLDKRLQQAREAGRREAVAACKTMT